VANLTITVDETVLQRARVRAVQRRESVNSYLAEVLRRYADQPDQQDIFAAVAALAAPITTASSSANARSWTRDDLYDV
jgi:hypothetical protein